MNRNLLLSLSVVLALGAWGAWHIAHRGDAHISESAAAHDHDHGHGHAHDDHGEHDDASARGPHGGRLLRDDAFALELAIFEQGVPPEFRAWFTLAGKSLPPGDVKLTVELKRPDGTVSTFAFSPAGDFARGAGEVEEPHSFDYTLVAEHAGTTHRWTFSAPEMQVKIDADSAARAGIAVEVAGPARLSETLEVYGQLKLNADAIAHAVPRFSGVAREARKALGEQVAAGEVVAVIEANQTLAPFEVKAPIAGTIVDRAVTQGEATAENEPLYTIANLAVVWAELNIPKRAQSRVKTGQRVTLHLDDGGADFAGEIAWLAPFGSVEGQTFAARVVVPNADGRWRPGLFLTAKITLAEFDVPLAVKDSALQTVFDFTVVFSQHGELYQARPLELGRRDGDYVEVLKGLRAGERYVTENSFLIKADLGKSGASHDH